MSIFTDRSRAEAIARAFLKEMNPKTNPSNRSLRESAKEAVLLANFMRRAEHLKTHPGEMTDAEILAVGAGLTDGMVREAIERMAR